MHENCKIRTGEQLSGSCAAASCSRPHWRAGGWSRCNATCGGGTMTRPVTCVDANGNAVADPAAACEGLSAPAAAAACNTAPCLGYTWQVDRTVTLLWDTLREDALCVVPSCLKLAGTKFHPVLAQYRAACLLPCIALPNARLAFLFPSFPRPFKLQLVHKICSPRLPCLH